MSELPPDDTEEPATDHRIEVNDEFDLVQSVTLREAPGGILLLSIATVYKHPTLDDARDGVAVVFGPNVAYVTIPNLTQRYQTWAEVTRYGVEVVYIPVSSLRIAPVLDRVFPMEETVIEPEEPSEGA